MPTAFCQRKADIGAMAGTSYYMGDINPGMPFYSPGISLGALYRRNFSSRYSLRFSANYVSLKGSDQDFPDREILFRNSVDFHTSLLDIASQVEFNFFPYKTTEDLWYGTPYIFGGVGYSFVLGYSAEGIGINAQNHLIIPFGVGYKLNVTRKLSAGVEWSFRKTFNDCTDGVVNPLGESFLHSNDWYSIFGLFITYKFFNFAGDCPVYN